MSAGASVGSLVPFKPQADSLTYERFFGLNEKPFSLIADARFVYRSEAHVATCDSLLAGIRRREGLLVLTGEIGTGKTTLCRAVLRDLGRKTYSSLVPDPFASREDLLKMLLIDFGVLSIQELTAGPLRNASRTELGYLLSEFLHALPADAHAIVVLDEAQNLSLPLIEESRILSDTFGAEGRLQIIFVGQPELHAKLKLPEMRQVDQRVCGYHRLAPMSRDAVAGYLHHRLQVAGGRRDQVLFPPEVVGVLHARSGGVPRLINRVCDRALHLAFERQVASVDRDILDAALIEIGADTLSPTWDAIIFAAPPATAAAPPPPAPTTAQPAPEAPPAPAADEEAFKQQVDRWVAQDLAPPARSLSPLPAVPDDGAPVTPKPERRRAPAAGRPGAATPRVVTTDWPRDLRSETYVHRLWRLWARRAAMAVALLVALNAGLVGAALVPAALTPPALPQLPQAPAAAAPGIALAVAPPVEAAPVASAPAVAAPAADAGDYLVAVGLFASHDRADQLVDALTQAGLPAMQRPVQLRQQLVQQVVLGPYFRRADADADLRRLRGLGGFGDAGVISNQ